RVHHAARRCRRSMAGRSPQYAVEFLKRGKGMPRIVHIAIKVDDLEKATKFYEEVFGFRLSRRRSFPVPARASTIGGSKWRIVTGTLPRSRRTARNARRRGGRGGGQDDLDVLAGVHRFQLPTQAG